MSLSIKDLKERINGLIGKDLISIGFSVDKSISWYTRRSGANDKVKIYVDTYNFLPERVEFTFIFQFYIHAIEEEKKRFAKFISDNPGLGLTFSLGEGYFHDEFKNLEIKYKNAFRYKIFHEGDYDSVLRNSKINFVNQVIPQIERLSTLKGFQDFVIDNLLEIGDSRFTLPSLIAMKLLSKEKFQILLNQLKHDLRTLPENHITNLMIRRFEEFSAID